MQERKERGGAASSYSVVLASGRRVNVSVQQTIAETESASAPATYESYQAIVRAMVVGFDPRIACRTNHVQLLMRRAKEAAR